jgi:predicted nucleic acid-binding protein
MKIIVDTSVWIEYFRANPGVVNFIDKGLLDGTVYMVGPVISELLQGVRNEKELEKLAGCIDAVPYIACSFTDWLLAGLKSFRLRKEGLTVPLTDLLIAAISINNKAAVYSPDYHFRLIPDVIIFDPKV